MSLGGDTSARPSRATLNGGVLTGYAWGENIGWVNPLLATPGQFVAFCYAKCDGSTGTHSSTPMTFSAF